MNTFQAKQWSPERPQPTQGQGGPYEDRGEKQGMDWRGCPWLRYKGQPGEPCSGKAPGDLKYSSVGTWGVVHSTEGPRNNREKGQDRRQVAG